MLLFLIGDDLPSVISETVKHRDLIETRLHYKVAQDGLDGFLLHLTALQEGMAVADSPTEYYQRENVLRFERELMQRNSPVSIAWYLGLKCMILYLLEQFDDVVATSAQSEV